MLSCDLCRRSHSSLPIAGGTTADALLSKQTARSLRSTLAPKLDGALHLSVAAYGSPVLSCTHFSSIAALLGNAGQTNYAASNAALDGLAQSQQIQANQMSFWKACICSMYGPLLLVCVDAYAGASCKRMRCLALRSLCKDLCALFLPLVQAHSLNGPPKTQRALALLIRPFIYPAGRYGILNSQPLSCGGEPEMQT